MDVLMECIGLGRVRLVLHKMERKRCSGKMLLMARVVHPAVLLEPCKGSDDTLLDGQFGFPTRCLDFSGIQKDERIIADPAFVASSVTQFGTEVESLADVAHGIVYLHVLGCAQIINLRLMLGFCGGTEASDVENRVDTVLDV